MSNFYIQCLERLCRYRGCTCTVEVNGCIYKAYPCASSSAREHVARAAFLVCRKFSINGGMLWSNGIVRGVSAHISSDKRPQRSSDTAGHSLKAGKYSDSPSFSRSIASTSPLVSQSRPFTDFPKMDSSTPCALQFEEALAMGNGSRVHYLLRHYFHLVAINEYEWLIELRSLGSSAEEIADILLEKSNYGPCLFAELIIPDAEGFVDDLHQKGCVHGRRVSSEAESPFKTYYFKEASPQTETPEDGLSPLEMIQYHCGIGGVKPTPTGEAEMLFGSLAFERNDSIAISRLHGNDAIGNVRAGLDQAAGILQSLQGCCGSFTYLLFQASQVELVQVDLGFIRSGGHNPLEKFFPRSSGENSHSHALAAQFLSLAFLSYAQAHCGAIRSFFLDAPLSRVILLGTQRWGRDFHGPAIVGSLVELSCFGRMLQQPVFVFEYLDRYRPAVISSTLKVRKDLFASPEDVLDTWGPGEFVAAVNNEENLYAISIGGGLITPISTSPVLLHWEPTRQLDLLPIMEFRRTEKVRIGAKVSRNHNCQARPQQQLQAAFSMLGELGTFPSYWEVSERQLGFGFQAGQSAIALIQFNQTWIKRHGMTKKSKMLAQKSLYIADLEGYFGIQVSACTGIARRVRLRDLLADILPVYVDALVARPPGWKSLLEDFSMLQALKEGVLSTWLESLDDKLQRTFESLVVAILFLLQDTGVDRKGENFILGCIQPGIPFKCFQIPCREENYWARMLADSEDIATFAYVTTQCLETDVVKCKGPIMYWGNSTGLLSTAVSCYQEDQQPWSANALSPSAAWTLKHLEEHLIGKPEDPLRVKVDRHNNDEEPCLLVSKSLIPSDFVRRIYRRTNGRRARLLKERGAINQKAENVVVLSSTGDRRSPAPPTP